MITLDMYKGMSIAEGFEKGGPGSGRRPGGGSGKNKSVHKNRKEESSALLDFAERIKKMPYPEFEKQAKLAQSQVGNAGKKQLADIVKKEWARRYESVGRSDSNPHK